MISGYDLTFMTLPSPAGAVHRAICFHGSRENAGPGTHWARRTIGGRPAL
jgi:hypothetical protein